MRPEAIVKSFGGNLVRLLQGLKVFILKNKTYPDTLIIDQGTLQSLKEYHLTPLGLKFLNIKLKVVKSKKEVEISFENRLGDKAEYGEDAWDFINEKTNCDEWLFGVKIYDEM